MKAGTVVKGTVCGQDGKKLQYATVVETDEIGRIVASAQTDNNGSFSLKVVNPQHKLRVSYVGFKSASLAIIETSRNYADAVEALKEEAIHVVRTMPRWEPGRQNGKRIDTSYTLPINFKLN